MKKLRKIYVALAKGELLREFRWFYAERWGEDATKTYLVKHSEKIDKHLTLFGVGELWHPQLRKRGRSCIDMIFHRGDTYYLVEVKNNRQASWNQLFEEVACFECDMIRHKENYGEIVPVCVCVTDAETRWESQWSEEDKKHFQEFWKLCDNRAKGGKLCTQT